jgi:hypothetical protein
VVGESCLHAALTAAPSHCTMRMMLCTVEVSWPCAHAHGARARQRVHIIHVFTSVFVFFFVLMSAGEGGDLLG